MRLYKRAWKPEERSRLRVLWETHPELPAWARVAMIASELDRMPGDVHDQLVYLRIHRPIGQYEDEALERRCAERQRVANERFLFPGE